MDIPDVDGNPSKTKTNQGDPKTKLEARVDNVKQQTPLVLVSSPNDREIMASGDQPDNPGISPAASIHASVEDERQLSVVSSNDSRSAAGDTTVSATASSTVQPDKSDEPPLTVSISANPIVSTTSDTTQPQLSDMSTTVTSDMPQQPVSNTPITLTSDTPQQPVTNVTNDMSQRPVSNTSTVTSDMPQQPVSNIPITITSDTQQLPASNAITVTSDMPQQPASSSRDSGDIKVKEVISHGSVTSHQFFPDIDTSQRHEHIDSVSVADSFTHEDVSSNKEEKLMLEKTRSDVTLGGPSTSGWTTDSEDSVSS